ncbi:RND transporter [Chromatiales bacterium (ex Bugula neritina AB1)]|nr:RND transporter [Chromatiales bacterium (ex Bugula neritina AB1)]
MLQTYVDALIKLRWFAIAATLVIVASLASGGRFLAFTNDYQVFFGKTNPQLAAFEELQETYTKNDNVLIMVEPADGVVFNRTTLQAVLDLTELAWLTPYSSRVDSITNFQYSYAEEDDLIVEDLIENVQELDSGTLQEIREIALAQPLLVDRLISPTAHVTGVNITFQLPNIDPAKEPVEIDNHLKTIFTEIEGKYPDVKLYKTGVVVMNKAFPDAVLKDMTTLIPAAFAVILFGFLLFTRNIWGTLGSLTVMVMSIMAAMGTAGWMGITLTPPSASAPTLILTLAVADCVHFLVTFFQEMQRGSNKITAIKESVRLNFNPIFLTSLTTAIGFLSMNFSDSPPFHDLGTITAIGVIYAFFLSVFFLPALMAVLPVRVNEKPAGRSTSMDALADFVIRQRKTLLLFIGAMMIALIAMIPKNELNDVFVNYFDTSIPFRTDTDHISKHLTGMYFVDYSLDSKDASGINKPDYIAQMELFEHWLEAQAEVKHVNALSETYRRLNKNMHADDDGYYRIPDQRDLAAQYLLMYEMSLPYGLDLNNQINVDKSASRISVTLETLSTKQVVAFEKRVAQWMQENTPALQTVGSSPTIMFSHIAKRNIVSMLAGTTIALVLISLILIVSLRSIKFGILSLIPNLVPAGMAFGVWALFVGEVGLAVSVVAAMTLGIVVDDTIHFLSKYLRARRERGMNAENAIRYAFNTVGVALFITTVILTAGFMIIAQSNFSLNSDMGLLTAITICIALLVDFLFLPTLLLAIDGEDSPSDTSIPAPSGA